MNGGVDSLRKEGLEKAEKMVTRLGFVAQFHGVVLLRNTVHSRI